jgi:hypothetical protein
MPSYLNFRSILFLTVAAFLAAPAWLAAQAPAVLQTPGVNGFAFGEDHTVSDEIWFTGFSVFPNSPKQPNRYKTFVNGEDLSAQAAFPLVPVGPFPPPGGWPQAQGYQYPFRTYFENRYNLMAPVVSDVFDTLRGQVIQRKRTLLYDRRYFDALIPRSTLAIPRGVGVQLTPEGLEKLEDLHALTLPQPNLDAFNDSLRNTMSSASNELTTDTRLFANGAQNPDRVCLP